MTKFRYHLSVALFHLAARVYPRGIRGVGQACYVGQRWLKWYLEDGPENVNRNANRTAPADLERPYSSEVRRADLR
jgi:hypothetical protein